MSLLVTVWHDAGELSADQFLGEVLLDLAAVDVRDSVVWYSLQEHDRDRGTRPRDGVVWYSLREHDRDRGTRPRDGVVWYSLQEHDRDGGTRPRDGVVWYSLQEHDLNCSSTPAPSPKLGHGSPQQYVVARSRSVSRQSSRDSSSRNTSSPDLTSTTYRYLIIAQTLTRPHGRVPGTHPAETLPHQTSPVRLTATLSSQTL